MFKYPTKNPPSFVTKNCKTTPVPLLTHYHQPSFIHSSFTHCGVQFLYIIHTSAMSKLVPCASYTTSQLKDALASLATKEVSKRIDDCSHIHGFFIDSSSGSADGDCSSSSLPFFKDDHELSMLQTITARRVLDYSNLLVSLNKNGK